MLQREDAQKFLKEQQTTNWQALCLSAIEVDLPIELHAAAYAVLRRDEHGKILPPQSFNSEDVQRHREAVERGFRHLAALTSRERRIVFTVLAPRIATTLEAAWQLLGRMPYQIGWQRRAFRAPAYEAASYAARRAWLTHIIVHVACYRDKDLSWFATWAPYLAAYNTQPFGILFAAAINDGGEEGDALFNILVATARGEHPSGKMGRHITTGLLVAAREDGWHCIEQLLLAAQREEGLRQVVLETVDEAHPQAFRRMLRLILEQDLIRFSATVRAADVWFGLHWTVEDAQAVRRALHTVLLLLDDQVRRYEVIEHGNPQELYFALWAAACTDAEEAIAAALPVLGDAMPERRFAAARLLGQVNLPEAQAALLPLLDDADLRVALCAFESIASTASTQSHDDLFERLERLLGRIGNKGKTINSGIWPWLEVAAHPYALLHTMIECLGGRDPGRLIPYVPLMSERDRVCVAKALAALPVWDEEVRDVLYGLLGERSRWISSSTLELLATRPLDEASTLALEQLLTRKSAGLRRGILDLLLKGNDEAVLTSARRLLTMSQAQQRLAGLDLLNGLVSDGRRVEQAILLADSYRDSCEAAATEEVALLDAIFVASQARETPTRENVLGLISPDQRSPRITPRRLVVNIDTPAARVCLCSIDALIEEHSTTPVIMKTWRGSEEMLLSNVNRYFPLPDADLTVEEDERARLPLAKLWLNWERERPAALRDGDGLELLRAGLLLKKTRATATSIITREVESSAEGSILFGGMSAFDGLLEIENTDASAVDMYTKEGVPPAPEREKIRLQHRELMGRLFLWLIRRQGMSVEALNFLLDTAEAALARVDVADLVRRESDQQRPLWRRRGLRSNLSGDGSLVLLRWYRAWHRHQWTPEQHKRYWQLLHWLDEPAPGLEHDRPALDVLMDAYRVGGANEADVLDQLGGPVAQDYRYRATDLYTLSTRAPHPLMLEHPILGRLVAVLRERILRIELARGELPTAATSLALSLRYSGGTAVFTRLVAMLAPTDLARGYTHDNESKRDSLSHLLLVSYPASEDTLEEFAREVREARLDMRRLVACAVFAPQWAYHVEYVLAWPHFADAVWWIYAHTKDNNWRVDEEVRKVWQAQVAERTPLTSEELLAGAVDVTWFWNSYHELGSEHWESVYAAAKYASSGRGHGRARLYADAMIGKVSAQELCQHMVGKRSQDAVRALGLVPLSTDTKEREAEIAERYRAFQEFKRSGRKFGAQRRVSEETAVYVGLENLSRTAGFPDPLRLQWTMEARTAVDLRDGTMTVTDGDVHVTLKLDNNSAEPSLTIVREHGKVLKALPARLKKHPDIIALTERKREVEQQIARMRATLEEAMCRGDHFTAGELITLLAHPVLSRLLQNLIFVRVVDERVESGKVLGYPRLRENATGPRLFFCDYDGAMTSVDLAIADLRVAHPYDLLMNGTWHAWQHECFKASHTQPFKQIFRELYVCTKNETRNGDETISQRYSGHQVQPRQALALLGQRGWVAGYEEGVRRTFHAEKLTAAVSFAQGIFTPAEVEGLSVEHVFFTRSGDDKPVPLASVPPCVFSEVMRDLDLMVSVAHSGGVDPEATASTVEMRASLVSETCMLLGLDNVTIKSAHALIEGTLGRYTVHLGSAVVHRQPGGALCIIPVHGQHRGRIFLPFADNDPKTSEVVSKVITLARDQDIKDPSILEQLFQAY
ncbi:MAG TPA: DUF5724 domain-containing protein [Ktedonobacteraceae bacterium]